MKNYYLCMEIGGTNLRYGVVDQNFCVLEFEKQRTLPFAETEDKIAYMEELFTPYLKKYGKENFFSIAMSLASLMDRERRICCSSPNIKGFDNLPLADILERRFGLPVYMERDVNTALLYEIWKRGGQTEGIVTGLFLGTGMGNAMCIDGKIYRGSTGASCELGHIPLAGFRGGCGCGKEGCIEVKAGGRRLAELAAGKYNCAVSDIFRLHGAEEDVKEIVYLCALALATEVTILDPLYVILGGGVTEIPEFPFDYFEAVVKENLRIPNPRESFCILKASADAEVGIVGAALNAKPWAFMK